MATTRKPASRRNSSANAAKPAECPPRVALAVQGSFGHIDYAAGVLDAFRAHNHAAHLRPEKQQPIDIVAASGCVEMMTPLWLYLADQKAGISFRDALLRGDEQASLLARQRIAPPMVRPDAWSSYLSGLIEAQGRLSEAGLKLLTQSLTPHGISNALRELLERTHSDAATHSEQIRATAQLVAALQDVLMYSSGLPGQLAFNPFFTADRTPKLEALCARSDGPTLFTNATRSSDFQEVYLYCGADPTPAQQEAMTGKSKQRQLLRLTPEYFFASGARPPYIAPMPVTVHGKTEYWMEGAMRCNPPLVPLIDMGATHLLVIRFFSKDTRNEPNNNAELNERFYDAIFNIPLQKEIESIQLNNQIARCMEHVADDAPLAPSLRRRREIVILDPADGNNIAGSPTYIDFLHHELNALSHYDANSGRRRGQMFDRGFQIGQQLIEDLRPYLP